MDMMNKDLMAVTKDLAFLLKQSNEVSNQEKIKVKKLLSVKSSQAFKSSA